MEVKQIFILEYLTLLKFCVYLSHQNLSELDFTLFLQLCLFSLILGQILMKTLALSFTKIDQPSISYTFDQKYRNTNHQEVFSKMLQLKLSNSSLQNPLKQLLHLPLPAFHSMFKFMIFQENRLILNIKGIYSQFQKKLKKKDFLIDCQLAF